MDFGDRIRRALRTGSGPPDEDVVEELAQHAEATYQAARAEGASAAEADARVEEQLAAWHADPGALQRPRARRLAEPPSGRSSRWLGLLQDVRFTARVMLRRQLRFALLTTATMALGIGATTLLFVVAYGALARPLPWPNAARTIVIEETRGGQRPRFGSMSSAAFLAWREKPRAVEEIAAWSSDRVTVGGTDRSERVRITRVSDSLFRVLGLRPLLGTLYDEAHENDRLIVISEAFWREWFGRDPGVVGRPVRLDGQSYSVVGVLPDGFLFPDARTRAFLPLAVRPASGDALSMFGAIALLRPAATATQAASEGTARGRFAADTPMTSEAIFGSDGPAVITATPLSSALTAQVQKPLLVLFAAGGLLLLAATANVASLQLARATTRRRELAIRAALGASDARLARQLLVEGLLLGAVGGACGLALAALARPVIPWLLPADFPRIDAMALDASVAAFCAGVTVVSGVLVGVLPALHVRGVVLAESIAEDGAAAVGVSRSRTTLRLVIMSGQVAIACLLLIGACQLGQGFASLVLAERGYDPWQVMTAMVPLPDWQISPERRYAALNDVLARLDGRSDVDSAGFTSELPLGPGGSTAAFTLRSPSIEGGGATVQASPRVISEDYFRTLGMRIVEGRSFAREDTQAAPAAAIVNRAFARRYLPSGALGAQLPMALGYGNDPRYAAVVGVVDDVRYVTATEPARPEIYYCFRQLQGRLPVPVVTVVARASGDTLVPAAALRWAIASADPALAPDSIVRLGDRIVTSLARPRLYAILVGAFASLALAIAAVGLFGVLSYTVAQRTRELAVRAAVGAGPSDLLRLVLRQGLAVCAAGLAVGTLCGVLLSRSLSALWTGVAGTDALAFVAAPSVLLAVAAAASALPAARAARVDVMQALRAD